MTFPIQIDLRRATAVPLADQIRDGIRAAIAEGRLFPGARLPSWRDLASQLGVARGTVRVAYERLADDQLIVSAGSAGTRIVDRLPPSPLPPITTEPSSSGTFYEPSRHPLIFQMGAPAEDAFPVKLWSRLRTRSVQDEALASASHDDPCGEPELRQEIAGYLALARGVRCTPSQIIITAGFRGALGLTLHALALGGRSAWFEEPGFPVTRAALEIAGLTPIPVAVDDEGIDVDQALSMAADAALAVVTPSQQAPLGVSLSRARRRGLLDWASRTGAWIIEDDYLGELQLKGRASPALAATDRSGRVIHIGSFSKNISPALGIGFLVAPPELVPRLSQVAGCLSPAPGRAVQTAVAAFMRDGHYMRHLRRMRRLYAIRRDALSASFTTSAQAGSVAGLAFLLPLPDGVSDVAIAREAFTHGLAPTPLSLWYATADARKSGLLLSITNATEARIENACQTLRRLIQDRA
jgi:GntR family transcriptional regulator/MocR family aminotransferase